MRIKYLAAISTLSLLFAGSVSAHGVWIAERLDQKQIILGEGPMDNAYKPNNVTGLQGYSKNWSKIKVSQINKDNHVIVEPTANVAVIALSFDYGYWTKNAQGKNENKPLNQVPGATKSTHAIKYSINYLDKVDTVQAVADIPLQIVPDVDPTQLEHGDKLPITVLKDNKPLANVPVIVDVINNLDTTILTDEFGKAVLTVPNQGLNVIGVEISFPTKNTVMATQDKFFTTLVFTLQPEDD